MSVTLTCACGNHLHVNDQLAGRQVQCPSCAAILMVPGDGTSESDKNEATAVNSSLPVQRRNSSEVPPIPLVPQRQTLLRSLALVFALLGGLTLLSIGLLMLTDKSNKNSLKEAEAVLERGRRSPYEMTPEEAQKVVTEHYLWLVRGGLLVGTGLFGSLGGFFAFSRRRWTALTLLVIAGFAPLFFQYLFLLVSFPCLISAVLTVSIRRRR